MSKVADFCFKIAIFDIKMFGQKNMLPATFDGMGGPWMRSTPSFKLEVAQKKDAVKIQFSFQIFKMCKIARK